MMTKEESSEERRRRRREKATNELKNTFYVFHFFHWGYPFFARRVLLENPIGEKKEKFDQFTLH